MRVVTAIVALLLFCSCRPQSAERSGAALQPVLVVYDSSSEGSYEESYAPRIAVYSDGNLRTRQWQGFGKNAYFQGQLSQDELAGLLSSASQVFSAAGIDDYYEVREGADLNVTDIELHASGALASKEIYGGGLHDIAMDGAGRLVLGEPMQSLPVPLQRLLLQLYQVERQAQIAWTPEFDERRVPKYPCAEVLTRRLGWHVESFFDPPGPRHGTDAIEAAREQFEKERQEYQARMRERYAPRHEPPSVIVPDVTAK